MVHCWTKNGPIVDQVLVYNWTKQTLIVSVVQMWSSLERLDQSWSRNGLKIVHFWSNGSPILDQKTQNHKRFSYRRKLWTKVGPILDQKRYKVGPKIPQIWTSVFGGVVTAEIDDEELVRMGDGALFKHNKLYIPARVVEYLELDTGEEVTYYQVFDPNYKDVVVIKKAG